MSGSILANVLAGLARGYIANNQLQAQRARQKKEDDYIDQQRARQKKEDDYIDQQRTQQYNDRVISDFDKARAEVRADGQVFNNPAYITTKSPEALRAEVDAYNTRAQALRMPTIDANQLETIADNMMREDIRAASKDYGGDMTRVTAYGKDRWGERFTRKFPEFADQSAAQPASTGPGASPLATLANQLQANDTQLGLGAGPLTPQAATAETLALLGRGEGPIRPQQEPTYADLKQAAPMFGALVPQVGNPIMQQFMKSLSPASAQPQQEPAAAPGATAATLADVAPSFDKPKSSFELLFGNAGTTYSKAENDLLGLLTKSIQNGSVSNLAAVQAFKNQTGKDAPEYLYKMQPTAQTADILGRGKREDRREFAKFLGMALNGDMNQKAWYANPITKSSEYPGMGAMANATIEQKKKMLDLAGQRFGLDQQEFQIAEQRLANDNARLQLSENADARAAKKAAAPPKKTDYPTPMTSGNRDKARAKGYGELAIKYGPAEVLQSMDYWDNNGSADDTKEKEAIRVIREKYAQKYSNTSGSGSATTGSTSGGDPWRDLANYAGRITDPKMKQTIQVILNGKKGNPKAIIAELKQKGY